MGRTRRVALALALLASASAATATEEEPQADLPSALLEDDECGAEGATGEGQCALNALQRQALRARAAAARAQEAAEGPPQAHGYRPPSQAHAARTATPTAAAPTAAAAAAAPKTAVRSKVPMNSSLFGDLKAMGPPENAMAYKGMAWTPLTVTTAGEIHIFVIGDWGGMDGSLPPIEGRPRIIAYKGGHSPGPHVFPRDRWDKPHTTRLCDHASLIKCFESQGMDCPPLCGYVQGVDDKAQFLVANALKARAALANPAFVMNVGDNFYWGGIEKTCGTPMGVISPTAQHQFNQVFEGIYQGPGLTGKPWLSVLGNHDWGGRQFNNGWDQQIAYTWASSRWVMPAPYWSQHVEFPGFTADIYMLDSNNQDAGPLMEDPEHNICGAAHNPANADCTVQGGPPSLAECQGWFQAFWAEQQEWLEEKLAQSTADWQIVVTHFPCGHEAAWYQKLRAKYGLDLLVTGHRHDQELTRVGQLPCIVSGGGGGITSEASPGIDRSQWYGEAQYGFYDLTISKSSMKIESVNYDGLVVKSAIITPTRR